VRNVGKMVHLAREEKSEPEGPAPEPMKYDGPKYPYGLSISLDTETLDKLGLGAEADTADVGDTLHLFALARVTAKRSEERESGKANRHVELQITHIALESEDDENEDEAKKTATRAEGRYTSGMDGAD
jgi:hypothetical protein